MTFTSVLLLSMAVLAAAGFASAAVLARRSGAMRDSLAESDRRRDEALAAEAATTRLLRLSASDLRDMALTLLGHADQIRSPGCDEPATHAAAIAAGTMQLLGLADDLQDHAVPDPSSRTLRLEEFNLGTLVRDAVAAVAATLGPGARHWRISPAIGPSSRSPSAPTVARSIRCSCACWSRHEDWIDLSLSSVSSRAPW